MSVIKFDYHKSFNNIEMFLFAEDDQLLEDSTLLLMDRTGQASNLEKPLLGRRLIETGVNTMTLH